MSMRSMNRVGLIVLGVRPLSSTRSGLVVVVWWEGDVLPGASWRRQWLQPRWTSLALPSSLGPLKGKRFEALLPGQGVKLGFGASLCACVQVSIIYSILYRTYYGS